MSEQLTHLSLFSGIGGLDLAAEWAGFRTVAQCEWADYPTRVLEKHWPDVPRWRDIRTLTKESFYERTGLRTVDVISGGFPCQPFSVAGKQRGKEDERFLWPEMLRVITEIEPRCVIGENVPGILRIAAADVVKDLERSGYECVLFDFEAAAVGAPHRRERIAFVAYAGSERRKGREQRGAPAQRGQKESYGSTAKCGGAMAYADGTMRADPMRTRGGCAGSGNKDRRADQPGLGGVADGVPRWLDEPDGVPRIATGIPNRCDRLKCLGNAVVPQQFYPIFRAIAEIMEDWIWQINVKWC